MLVLGCWFGAGAIVFSSTKGVLHPYYLAGIGPPLAGLVGVGTSTFRFDLEASRRRAALGIVALGSTALTGWLIWRRFDWRTWFIVAFISVLGAVIVGAIVIAIRVWVRGAARRQVDRRTAIGLTIASVFAALLAPAMWTQGSLQFPSISVPSLVSYLRDHNHGERWDVAVESACPAEELIISSGEPVMAIGGFIGSDPIEPVGRLQQRVRDGEVRYFLMSAEPGGLIPALLGNVDSIAWIDQRCRVVPSDVWEHDSTEDTAKPGTRAFPGGPVASAFKLYDCTGAG